MRALRALIPLVAAFAAGCSSDGPVVPPTPGALRYATISAGYYHTCALSTAGSAWCWGQNTFGTLGDGTRDERRRPTAVAPAPRFTALDAGAGHNCALDTSGHAWCWGQNDEGQVGDGSFTIRDRPAAVSGSHSFVSISAGHAHTCGLTADGSAWCWGDNISGQLGDGTAGGRSSAPVRVATDVTFARVEAGYYQTCALDAAGHAWCWGQNDSGQLGNGSAGPSSVPVAVSGNRAFTDISAGDRFVCGLASGDVWCWGASRAGELGQPDGSPTPVRVGSLQGSRIAASMGTSTTSVQPYGCVLDGGITCWGGRIRAIRTATSDPATLRFTGSPTRLTAGADHVCVLDRSGYAWCGGGNFGGQLGSGNTADASALAPVLGPTR